LSSKLTTFLTLLLCTLLTACGSPEERAAQYLEKAEALYEQEDYVTARIEAMNAAQIEPRNAEVRFLLAKIEEHEQEFRKAIGHLQVAIDADPTHLESRIKLGNYFILGKAYEPAAEQANAAIELAPDDARVMMLQARVHFLNDEHDLAMKQIDAALTKDPKLVEAIMFKAGLLMADGDTELAMQITQNAIDSADEEDLKQLRKFRILLLRSAERFDEIEVDLNALIEDYPDEEGFPLALAQLYVMQERTDEAEAIYRAYIAKDPQDILRRIEFTRFIGAQHGPEAAKDTLKMYADELPESMELQLALARLHEALKEQDEAFAIYEQIAGKDPKSVSGLTARNRMAAIMITQNRLDEAKIVIESILVDKQDNPDALMVRAAFYFSEKRYDEAVADLRLVIRSRPKSERALLLLARSHNVKNNRELAQDAYRRLIEINPVHPDASSELAELLARSGNISQAEEVLRNQLETDPEDRQASSRLIQALLLQGDIEAAEEQARTMLDFGDDTGLAEFQLGRVLQAKQSSQQAIDAYKSALQKNPAAPEPLQGLVAILINSDRSDEAVSYLRTHLEQYPEQLAPRLLLAAVYTRQGEVEAAAQQYEDVISLRSDATRAYASLARLYPDDPKKRRDIFRRGIDANPKDLSLYLLLAGDYEQTGQTDEAIGAYEKVLANDPSNIIAANNLAAILLDFRPDNESHKRALELSRQFEDSNRAELLDTLGWAYYRNEDYGNAIRLLEAAVAQEKGMALLHYHLGMAFVKAEMTGRGREELKQSLSLTKEPFTGIEEARATLKKL
jgi:tetratricopeptide (TPR) repeat protein